MGVCVLCRPSEAVGWSVGGAFPGQIHVFGLSERLFVPYKYLIQQILPTLVLRAKRLKQFI